MERCTQGTCNLKRLADEREELAKKTENGRIIERDAEGN